MADRIAWAAGFFDGEGCVSITKRAHEKRTYYCLKLDVFQVDKTPLDLFVFMFGGTLRMRPRSSIGYVGSRDGWVWCQCGHPAATTLTLLLPHLVCKKAQAEIAIEFQSKKTNRGCKSYVDPVSHFEKERQQFEEVKRLKVVT